jgi:hypothetical protein
MSLHDELQRIADAAPVADVPRDTWARARRARGRDRALAVAAGVAAVVMVAGLVAWLPRSSEPPVAAGSDAVPDHVWGVPSLMADQTNDGEWMRAEVETDLAIGRGAVAFTTREGLPVIVGAADGAYHLLDLPERLNAAAAASSDGPLPALSPNGRQLAWAWAGPAPTSGAEPMPSGIKVADLETGRVRTIELHGGHGVIVQTIRWSPGGSWLVWSGSVTTSWTEMSTTYAGQVVGRVAPNATTSEEVPTPRDEAAELAVSDRGEVGILAWDSLTRWDGHVVRRIDTADRSFGQLSAFYRGDELLTFASSGNGRSYRAMLNTTTRSMDYAGTTLRLGVPEQLKGRSIEPLAQVDRTHLLVRAGPHGSATDGTPPTELALVGLGDNASYRVVGTVDQTIPDISVASDLVSLAHPTASRPEPDWPWSDERLVLTIGLGVAAAVALVVGALWLRRRYRAAR